MPPTDVFISAGEASGDMYAARLAVALRQRADVRLFGMGGPKMREAGVETVVNCAEVNVLGVVEILRKLPVIRRAFRRLLSETQQRRPAMAILTDFPAFHLRLSRVLRRRRIRNVYFVCPQFWAWRPWRVRILRRRFVRGLCIFRFEEDFFRRAGVPVDWIGHPLVDQVHATASREELLARYRIDANRPVVALLPGSRDGELSQHLPRLIQAALLIQERHPCQFLLALAPGLKRDLAGKHIPAGLAVQIVENETYNVLSVTDVAMVSSGTATVETALMGVPMVVVYRVSPLTAWVARRLVTTPSFAMVNLIAGKKVVPELFQDEFTPERVAEEVYRLLSSSEARDQMKQELAVVRQQLGDPGAIDRAASIIAGMLNGSAVSG